MSWHITQDLAVGYVAGQVQGARAASVEAHVMACADCRSLVAGAAPADRLGAIWSSVEEQVTTPRPSWLERLLTRAGLPETDARLVAAAPSLHASWITAIIAVLTFAVLAGQTGGSGTVVFLIVAPLVPVLAVAGSYGPGVDPTYETSVSTPYPTMRLVLLRSVTVVLVSGLLAALSSAFIPDASAAAAWLLPSLALVTLSLLLARWLALPVAAGAVGAAYGLPLMAALYVGPDASALVQSAALQWTALAVGVVGVVALTIDPQLRAALRRVR